MITDETKSKLYELVEYYTKGKFQEFQNISYSSIEFKKNKFQELQKEHNDLIEMIDSIE